MFLLPFSFSFSFLYSETTDFGRGGLYEAQVNEGRYLYEQPDIVGMTFDCVNVALLSAPTARLLLAALWFREFAATVLKGAPNCDHPKVLHTSVVFASRLAAWVDVSESQIRLSLSSGSEEQAPPFGKLPASKRAM